MKSPDVRFLAWSIFALALSLPLTAWVWSSHTQNPLPLSARFTTAPPAPRYQLATQDHFVYRIDTQTGAVQYYGGDQTGWLVLDKETAPMGAGGVAIKN